MSSSSVASFRGSALLPALAAAMLALTLYAVTLGGTWVYDDLDIARNDPRLHDIHKWPQYFTSGYPSEESVDHLWRPLTSLSFAIQWQLNGDRGWPFHLVNILLNAGASALVAVLAWKLGGARAAWIAGLLFAAHPVHVEAVAYLVGRCETLATIGVLGGLVLYIRPRGQPLTYRRVLGIFGCFILAIFSKEQGLLLPAMMLAWSGLSRWWQPRDVGGGGSLSASKTDALDRGIQGEGADHRLQNRGPRRLLVMLIVWTMAAYISYRDHILPWFWEPSSLDWPINPLVRSIGWDRWLLPLAILGRYVALLAAPWRLSPDYSASVFLPELGSARAYLAPGIVAIVAYAGACIVAVRRRSVPLAFCLFCLGISYFLVSNILLIGTVFGERLMYMPSAFVLIIVSLVVARILERTPASIGWPRRLVAAVLGLVVIAYGVRAVTYARRWNDRASFYAISLREQPRSVQLGMLVAMDLRERGELPAAAAVLVQTCQQTPNFWKPWYIAAKVAMEQGRLDDAQRMIRIARELNPMMVGSLDPWSELARRRAATQPSK
jgi:hypothetical protein